MKLVTTNVYERNAEAWLGGKRQALNEGGSSSSKTWSILQLLILIAMHTKGPLLISVVSESFPHLKRGCIRDFFNILGESQDNNLRWSKTDHIYTFGKGQIEFFSIDEPDKARGGRRDILFINEANNVPYDSYLQLDMRTRLFTFLDWNPTGEFWVHEKGLNNDPENVYIHSTYQDALHVLPPETVAAIEKLQETDPNAWRIFGLGLMGKIEGLVYPFFTQVEELPRGDHFYGLDFGFSGDPAVLTRNVMPGEALYSEELIYEIGLTNHDISVRMSELGLRKHYDEIWADAAEPKSIEELCREGWNVKPCPKGEGSVEYGHQKVRQKRQHWTKGSLHCIKEQRNFRYIADKNGRLTEKTTHLWSHCLVAGTMVTTDKGEVSIERIKVGDMVMTRSGWRKVRAAGMTSPSRAVRTVWLSNGKTLTGTANHLVYVCGKAFVPLAELKEGDELCTVQSAWNTMAGRTADTRIQGTGPTALIFDASRATGNAICTGKSGLMHTVQFLKAMRCITRTLIHSTMQSKTWTASQLRIIRCVTPSLIGGFSGSGLACLPSARSQYHGIGLKLAANGTGNMQGNLYSIAQPPRSHALNAAARLLTLGLCHKTASAPMPVNPRIAAELGQTTCNGNVGIVERCSQSTNTASSADVHVHVVGTSPILAQPQPVFDLTVDGLPEFFANGVLVHNSMDSRRYAVMGKSQPVKKFMIGVAG